MNVPLPHPTPPNELYLVGERNDDPSQLLLRGTDGNYYAYSLPECDPTPVEVDEDWNLEEDLSEEMME